MARTRNFQNLPHMENGGAPAAAAAAAAAGTQEAAQSPTAMEAALTLCESMKLLTPTQVYGAAWIGDATSKNVVKLDDLNSPFLLQDLSIRTMETARIRRPNVLTSSVDAYKQDYSNFAKSLFPVQMSMSLVVHLHVFLLSALHRLHAYLEKMECLLMVQAQVAPFVLICTDPTLFDQQPIENINAIKDRVYENYKENKYNMQNTKTVRLTPKQAEFTSTACMNMFKVLDDSNWYIGQMMTTVDAFALHLSEMNIPPSSLATASVESITSSPLYKLVMNSITRNEHAAENQALQFATIAEALQWYNKTFKPAFNKFIVMHEKTQFAVTLLDKMGEPAAAAAAATGQKSRRGKRKAAASVDQEEGAEDTAGTPPAKKGRGRVKGSKNKPRRETISISDNDVKPAKRQYNRRQSASNDVSSISTPPPPASHSGAVFGIEYEEEPKHVKRAYKRKAPAPAAAAAAQPAASLPTPANSASSGTPSARNPPSESSTKRTSARMKEKEEWTAVLAAVETDSDSDSDSDSSGDEEEEEEEEIPASSTHQHQAAAAAAAEKKEETAEAEADDFNNTGIINEQDNEDVDAAIQQAAEECEQAVQAADADAEMTPAVITFEQVQAMVLDDLMIHNESLNPFCLLSPLTADSVNELIMSSGWDNNDAMRNIINHSQAVDRIYRRKFRELGFTFTVDESNKHSLFMLNSRLLVYLTDFAVANLQLL